MKTRYIILFWTSFVVVASFTIPNNNLEQNPELADSKDCKCENGVCVYDNRGKGKCSCFPRFALTDNATCKPCDCGKKGKCLFFKNRQSDGSIDYEKKCICDKGSAEKGGTCTDCQCGENSQCEFEEDHKICYCLDGYTEKDDVCTECNCGEYGSCKFVNGYKKCTCFETFTEINGTCEEKCVTRCGDDPDISCENDDGELEKIICGCRDSKLVYDNDERMCKQKCAVQCGYDTNILCQNDDGELEKVICGCSDRNFAYYKSHRMCVACDCGEHSKGCAYDLSGVKTCQCDHGYMQRGKQCEACDCGEHSNGCTVDSSGSKICQCEPGYVQRGEQCKVGCGVVRSCLHGGQCENGFCKCNPSISGDFCEIINCNDLCPSKNETSCAYDIARKRAFCKCYDKALAYDSDKQVCRRTCVSDDVCKNGGTCYVPNSLDDYKFCKCFYGTSGDYCEDVEGCHPHNDFCKDESICHFDVDRKKASCKCPDANKDYDRESEKCRVSCDDRNSCKNTGTCTGYDVKFCRCKTGTSGHLCERIEDCENPDFCGNSNDVRCVFDYQLFKGACLCYDGSKKFDPNTKQCKITCDSGGNCFNGGFCVERGGHNFCECLEGTSGDLCEIVIDCQYKIKCKDGALCEFDVRTQNAVCECQDEGKRYESSTESCKSTCEMLDYSPPRSTCKNGGACVKNVDSLFCKCMAGTSGDFCETVDGCKNMVCKDGANCVYNTEIEMAMCSCKIGKLYDPYNEICRKTCGFGRGECHNGGKCGERNFCHCLRGTSGDFCEIIDVCDPTEIKCKGDAYCIYDVEKEDAACKCPNNEEFYDTMNERCKRKCDVGNRKCSFGGKCDNRQFCHCLPGTTGDLCEIIEDCAKEEDKCKDEAYCDYDVAKEEAFCRCKYNGERYDTRSQTCKKTCDGTNSKCRNGGSCDGNGELKFCKCLSGTSGDLCDIVDECEKNQDKCKDGAECVYDIDNKEANCRCKVDGEQYDLWTETCRKICTSMEDCLNGGVCKVVRRAKFCDCVPGTSGDICEEIYDCQTGIYKQCIGDNGRCEFDLTDKKAKCECPGGKEFDDRLGICRECDCGPYAVSCDFSKGKKTCTCSDGFAERNDTCEKTKCTEKSCHDGKCEVINGQEECSCFEGYALEGDYCKKLNCSRTACINGTCVVRYGNVEECVCGAGFTLVKDTCKKGVCRIDTCYGGKCETVEGELVCVCPKGFHLDGIGCYETQCVDQPCFGGKCVVQDKEEICTCGEGHVLVNVVCKKILCEEKSCFGGQCHLVDGKEECSCPVGFSIYDDVCREDL